VSDEELTTARRMAVTPSGVKVPAPFLSTSQISFSARSRLVSEAGWSERTCQRWEVGGGWEERVGRWEVVGHERPDRR
jgi:hypothetical protein